MRELIHRISSVLLVLCMFVLLSLGNTYAGVCDEFGLDASDSYYIPAPITKFCVLAGSDPPKKWVPEKGFGKGLTNLHSGLQVVTGKASSLCPSPKMGDGAKGCPDFQFPNCATIPSDDPAQQTAQAKSGACVKGDATIEETANASENDVDETYEDITADDIKCAVQVAESVSYVSEDAPQSVCYGGNAKFCSTKGEKDTCDTKDDSELPNTDFPHSFAADGWVQMNDVESIKVGSGWIPDLGGGDAFMNMPDEERESIQEMMIKSMFQMTGDFKTTEETLLELNNDLFATWKKENKVSLGITEVTVSVDVMEVKCTRSTIIIPADTLFSIRNIKNKDLLEKYIVFWNNSPTLYKRSLADGSRTGDVSLQSLFVGLMPPAGNINLSKLYPGQGTPPRNIFPKLPELVLGGKPLMKSGNITVFKNAIKPHDYDFLGVKIPAKRCILDSGWRACRDGNPCVGGSITIKNSDIKTEQYLGQSGVMNWDTGLWENIVDLGLVISAPCPWDPNRNPSARNRCTGIRCVDTTVDEESPYARLNQSTQYRLCAKRKCRWSIQEVMNGKFACEGNDGWEMVND